MSKSLLTLLILVTHIVVIIIASDDKVRYRNLYGYKDDQLPPERSLLNLTVGALKFMRESERQMNTGLKDSTPKNDEEYDFVVIGAGSAGATIASRLSEVPEVTVLLIEAGRNENLMMDIPILVNYLQLSDEINWKYQTEPSDHYCLGMTDHKCNWPRGKVMGGSSVLNYMIATRGDPRDYDNWAAMGNYGWSYKEVLEYFKKLETIGVDHLRRDSVMHNTNGPLYIGYPPYHTPLAESFLEAGLEMGYPTVDYNADEHVGFSLIQSTIKNGTRMSTNRAYLYPARKRKNLILSKRSHVDKILIDDSKRAYGVEFTKADVTIRVRARKEVILSAGAINSPQILMLSGIGPSKHLAEMKINLVQDAPVGENLMDHIAYGGLVFLVNQPVSIVTDEITNPNNPYLRDFLNTRSGPYTIPGGCEALAFVDVDQPRNLSAYPNVELMFVGGSLVSDSVLRTTFGLSMEHWTKMFSNYTSHHSWTIFPMLMRPNSRGKILLRNTDPKSKPKIYPNYFEDPEDVRIMVKGVRASIEVSKTKAMQKFESKYYDQTVPGCEDYVYDSDEYWECAVRTYTFTIYHYAGTCKMAPENDQTGVVNPRLQVSFNFCSNIFLHC